MSSNPGDTGQTVGFSFECVYIYIYIYTHTHTHTHTQKILEVNLFAFAYRLFRRDFSPLSTLPLVIPEYI